MSEPNTPSMDEGTGLEDAADAIEALFRPGPPDKPNTNRAAHAANAADDSDEDEDEALEADDGSTTPEDDDADEASEDSEETDEAADEEETSSEPLDPTADATVKVRVTINGKEEVVDLRTLANGFQFQSVVTRKAQALAEERKSFEGERQQVTQERDEYGQLITALRSKLSEIEGTVKEPDWQSLRQTNPQEYIIQRDAWREHQELKALAAREEQRVVQERSHEEQTHMRRYAESQKEMALEAVPAWKDAATWNKDRTAMIAVGRKVGLSDAELDKASVDHRVLVLLHKAAQYDRQQAARAKPVRPEPPSRAPVARPSSTALSPQPVNAISKAQQRLAQTGSKEDAADVFDRMFAKANSKKKG